MGFPLNTQKWRDTNWNKSQKVFANFDDARQWLTSTKKKYEILNWINETNAGLHRNFFWVRKSFIEKRFSRSHQSYAELPVVSSDWVTVVADGEK